MAGAKVSCLSVVPVMSVRFLTILSLTSWHLWALPAVNLTFMFLSAMMKMGAIHVPDDLYDAYMYMYT